MTTLANDEMVEVHLRLSDDRFGTATDRQAVFDLEKKIAKVLILTKTGELDGEEFGGGEAVILLYGPDADLLFASVEPLLRESPFARAGYAVKQYTCSPEEKVNWG